MGLVSTSAEIRFDPDITHEVGREALAGLASRLEADGAKEVEAEPDGLTFRGSMFRGGNRKRCWGTATSGEVFIVHDADARALRYTLRFTEMFVVAGLAMLFFGTFMVVTDAPLGFIVVGLPVMWCWFYGLNVVFTRRHFSRALKATVGDAGGMPVVEKHVGLRIEWVLIGVLALACVYPIAFAIYTDLSYSPLHRAVERGDVEEVRRLAAEDPVLLESRQVGGRTPLHLAVDRGPEMVTALLDCGADIDARDRYGNTPLHFAVSGEHLPTLRLLLSRGAGVDARADDGETPLYVAAYYGNAEAAEVLLDHGADPDVRDDEGTSPFHRAVFGAKTRIVEFMLKHGADVHLANGQGETPMRFAERHRDDPTYREIYEILKKHEKQQ